MTDKIIIHPAKPGATATLLRGECFPTLISHQDEWLVWRGGAYEAVEDATIRSVASAFLSKCVTMTSEEDTLRKKYLPCNPTPKMVADVVSMLKMQCHAPRETMSPPCFLAETPPEYDGLKPENLISFPNGILDITTRKLYPPSPSFFTRTVLAVEYDASAPKPEQWLKFLDQVLLGRETLIKGVQEWLGYKISTSTKLHRIAFLYGQPRSGKGTILRIENALVGKRNCIATTIQDLAGTFGRADLIGKSSAQITDMDATNRDHLSTAANHLNAISGEDAMGVPRKNISGWYGTLGVRFTLAGNTLPNFGSQTLAMLARLLVIPFEVSFRGREDRELTDKLLSELPGIMNWALDGLDDLNLRGDFDEPEESRDAKLRLQYRSDPIHGFIAERCILDPDTGTSKEIIFKEYESYCRANACRVVPLNVFTQKLADLFPEVLAIKHRTGDDRSPCYRGIRLADRYMQGLFQHDPEMVELFGAQCHETMRRDASGWPMPVKGKAEEPVSGVLGNPAEASAEFAGP